MEETNEQVEQTEEVVTEETEQAVNTENAEPSAEETTEEKTFTQSELDDIITKRIERERETVTKKTAQEARDNYIAEQGYEWEGKLVKTEAEYKQAVKEQELIDNYKQKDLPDEVIKELVESQKFREKYNEQQKTTEQQTKQQDDYKQFIESFPDAKAEDIPASVWEQVDKGKSLVDAYTHHENQSLKEQLKSLTEKKEIEQTNEENAASSTGSVTGQGTAKAARFTRDQVDKMSREDVDRNWSAIQKSMKNWE